MNFLEKFRFSIILRSLLFLSFSHFLSSYIKRSGSLNLPCNLNFPLSPLLIYSFFIHLVSFFFRAFLIFFGFQPHLQLPLLSDFHCPN